MDRARPLRLLLLACVPLFGCPAAEEPGPGPAADRSGGAGGRSTGGAGGGALGGGGQQGGSSAGGSSAGGSSAGGSSASGGSSAGGSSAGGQDAPADLAGEVPASDLRPASDATGETSTADGDHLPGRPDLKICRKEWTAEQCCAFLCACLTNLCSDSPKGRPGIATCMSWCPKLSDMSRRCHVYHCYVSVSPTGGIRDHDSHCGHAADQVPGGSCPAAAYQR